MQIWWGWEGVVAVGGGYMVNLEIYRKTSNMRRTLVCNKIVDLSDVVGAAPAPTKSSFSTWHLASRDSAKKAARQYENLFKFWYLVRLILETWRYAVIYSFVCAVLYINTTYHAFIDYSVTPCIPSDCRLSDVCSIENTSARIISWCGMQFM